MTIADWRDWIIVIYGALGIIFIIVLAILAFVLYQRVMDILNDVKSIADKAKTLASYAAKEIVEPLVNISATVQGAAEGLRGIQRIFGKGGKQND